MKRRGFLQALGGAVAAVFAPAVASKTAVSLADKYPFTEFALSIPITPPETISELRALIEYAYQTVGEVCHAPYVDSDYVKSGGQVMLGGITKKYRGFHIIGKGNNEREAVADAFKTVAHGLGGKELLWRRKLSLDVWRDFEDDTIRYVVRGRAAVLV